MSLSTSEKTGTLRDSLSLPDIEAFIYREGRLLDEARFDEWLELWAQDAHYWVPIGPDEAGPLDHVSIIYDDRNRLEQRVRRLNSEYAWAHVPHTLSARLISNIELRDAEDGDADNEVRVSASTFLGEFRNGKQEFYCGRLLYLLRLEQDGLRIALKKVSLINRSGPMRNISAVL